MSNILFTCPHCQQSLESPDEMLGETIDCPSCNRQIQIPKPPPPPLIDRPHGTGHPTQQNTRFQRPLGTTVKQSALIGGVVCFVLGIVMMCFSLWTVVVYAPLFLAAFVLSITAMAQKRMVGGVLLLALTVIVPPILLLAIHSIKSGWPANQEAARATRVSPNLPATAVPGPEATPSKDANDSEPAQPEAEQDQERKLRPPVHPVFEFNLYSLPYLPEGEQAILMEVPAFRYNDVWGALSPKELVVKFGGENFYVYVESFTGHDGFILSRSTAQQLVALMEKYREWNTKALGMGTTVQKDIGVLSVGIFWMDYDDEWRRGARPAAATCSFLSQNKQRHQMTMKFEKVPSIENEYMNHRPETIYFDVEGINAFLEAFSSANIETRVAEHGRKKQLESQFQ